jgi:hypothetical protein
MSNLASIRDEQVGYGLMQQWVSANPGQMPANGQRFGNKVWNSTEKKLIDPANATDPNQITNWMAEGMNAGQGGLPDFFSQLSPENMQRAMTLLGPIFAQQTGALNRQQNTAMTGATNQAGAYAASRGIDNPMSLLSRARSGVQQQFAPQFDALRTQQMQAPLSLLGQQYQSLVAGKQFDFNRQQTLLGAAQQNRQYEDSKKFDFWRDAFPGLLSGGFALATGGIGGMAGAAAGMGTMARPNNRNVDGR